MVETYWHVGRQIYEAQGENERAEYGAGLIKYLSKKLTEEFGKGYTVTNLSYMRQFYLAFPNYHSVSDRLSWTHYRLILKVDDEKTRQINSFYYQRLISSRDKEPVRDGAGAHRPSAESASMKGQMRICRTLHTS